MKDPKTLITVTTTVQAPLERVWDRWTRPEHITAWNFASPEWCCPQATNDLRPNGKFSWRMEARDGSMGFDFNGIFNKIEERKLIAYSIEDGRNVVIQFEETEAGTIVSETFEAENMNSIELQRTGWQAILDNFKRYAESNQ